MEWNKHNQHGPENCFQTITKTPTTEEIQLIRPLKPTKKTEHFALTNRFTPAATTPQPWNQLSENCCMKNTEKEKCNWFISSHCSSWLKIQIYFAVQKSRAEMEFRNYYYLKFIDVNVECYSSFYDHKRGESSISFMSEIENAKNEVNGDLNLILMNCNTLFGWTNEKIFYSEDKKSTGNSFN